MSSWTTNTETIEQPFGFIYCIHYTDGTMYVGKKQIASKKTLPALKVGEVRDGATRIYRNILRDENDSIIVSKADRKKARAKGLKAKREGFDVMYTESKWETYEGSCEAEILGDRTIEYKEILLFCATKKELSYREEEALFTRKVLEDDNYLNSNIGGCYFTGDLIKE